MLNIGDSILAIKQLEWKEINSMDKHSIFLGSLEMFD